MPQDPRKRRQGLLRGAGQVRQRTEETAKDQVELLGLDRIREHPEWWPKEEVIEPAEDSPAAAMLAEALLERGAQKIETDGPDDVHVTLRAAERCAAIVRAMKPKTE